LPDYLSSDTIHSTIFTHDPLLFFPCGKKHDYMGGKPMPESVPAQHPTFIHRLIWWDQRSLTPLSLSLPGLKTDDPALIESCRSLRGFFEELLEDMYQNPEAYYMNPGEYETYLHGRSEIEARRANKKEHNNVRSKCYWSQGFHLRFLYEASRCGEVTGDGLVINGEDYQGVAKQVGKSPYLKDVKVHTRIAALARLGLEVVRDGSNVILSCAKNPAIFLAMMRLSRGGEANKTFGQLNFKCCNFQQIQQMYLPDYPVITHVLEGERAQAADRLNQYAAAYKMAPKPYGVWKVNYTYKGMAVFRFNIAYGAYELYVHFGSDSADLAQFDTILRRQPVDLQNFCLKHTNYCQNCGYCENPAVTGPKYDLFGRQVRTRGFPALRIINPEEEQMTWIEKVIDLRLETIRALKA